jgi:hypothetical protein
VNGTEMFPSIAAALDSRWLRVALILNSVQLFSEQ